jgi:RNA polymerase sigma factor (TIGR02999 family)
VVEPTDQRVFSDGSPQGEGDDHAPGRTQDIFPVVYDELRGLASARLTHERAGHSLQTTALVHEVYLRLQKDPTVSWNSPGHFFGAAAESMRRILIERARRRLALKRGGDRGRLPPDALDGVATFDDAAADGMLELDKAIGELEAKDATVASVVKLRYFAGLSVEDTATALDRSPRSVKRDWAFARAWLANRLSDDA